MRNYYLVSVVDGHSSDTVCMETIENLFSAIELQVCNKYDIDMDQYVDYYKRTIGTKDW